MRVCRHGDGDDGRRQLVSYVDHGGAGPAVVLLHSFLMDASMWAPQVAAFGQDYRLIAIDERGRGDTSANASFDYWDVVRRRRALLELTHADNANPHLRRFLGAHL